MDRIYYRDPTVRVSAGRIEVGGRAYELAELARVWHQRGRRSWRTVARRGALGMAMLLPLALAAVGLLAALSIRASRMVTVAVVLGAVLVGLLAGPLADVLLEHLDRSYARGSREMEIWALWRGGPVLLLRTRDRLRFGKIYRALQRAVDETATPGADPAPRSGLPRQGRASAQTDGPRAGAQTDGRQAGAQTDRPRAGAQTDGPRASAQTDGPRAGAAAPARGRVTRSPSSRRPGR